MSQIVLELKGISKTFPGVKALNEMQLQVYAGEVHALMGENGAGKSTLMNIINGSYQKDSGEIYMDGRLVEIRSINDAAALGMIQRGFRNNYLIIGSTEPDSAEGVMNLMRKDGYRKALADAGIAFAEDHVIENVRSIHESYRVVTQLLKSGAGRIGLCMNMDHLALAAISAAHDCGARIPEDIGLVGYDDIDSAKYMTPALTTISQSKYAIGAQSAIQVINARDGTEPWRKVLKPTLVVRRST